MPTYKSTRSDPPTHEELAGELAAAVDVDLSDEAALEIVLALQGSDTSRAGDARLRNDTFRQQLSHRLKQARIQREQ